MDPRHGLPDRLGGVGCTVCGEPVPADRIVVLAQREALAFLELRCRACGSDALGLVILDEDSPRLDVARTGEFGPDDELRLGSAAPIGDDDVTTMRAFLAEYRGDLRSLLGRSTGDGGAGSPG